MDIIQSIGYYSVMTYGYNSVTYGHYSVLWMLFCHPQFTMDIILSLYGYYTVNLMDIIQSLWILFCHYGYYSVTLWILFCQPYGYYSVIMDIILSLWILFCLPL